MTYNIILVSGIKNMIQYLYIEVYLILLYFALLYFTDTVGFLFKIYLFRKRGREGEREGKKHQCVVASHVDPIGDLALTPGICPDWESNWRPFGSLPAVSLK